MLNISDGAFCENNYLLLVKLHHGCLTVLNMSLTAKSISFSIVILVDLSLDTFETLAELQLEIKQLLEQQLTNKNLFNMIW